jgi:fructokinase
MQNPGGAVANVAAALAGFGADVSFAGMVGNDAFGNDLKEVLQSKNVGVSGLRMTDKCHTTLAFVHLFDNGDRDFTFMRSPGADIMYSQDDIDKEAIKNARLFHFGSLSLTDEPVRSATFAALNIAKENGVAVSYDPNYRAPLWQSEGEAKTMMLRGLEYADIVKISDNEVHLLFGSEDYEETAAMLISNGVKLAFITLGSEGAVFACADGVGRVLGYPAKAIDATGAGDCFTASVLYQYLKSAKTWDTLTTDDVASFVDFANAAASVCVEKRGGMPSMPGMTEVRKRQNKRLSQGAR